MKNEDGFTLIEVLVTGAVMVLVAFATLQFFDSTTNLSTRTNRNIEAEKDAEIALKSMTQDIRGANPISATYPTTSSCAAGLSFSTGSGYPNCLRFVVTHSANANQFCIDAEVGRVAAPYTRHTYGLVGQSVLHDRTEYNADCSVDTARSATGLVVITSVVNASQPGAPPLFRYYNRQGAQITTTTATNVVNAATVHVDLVIQYRETAPLLKLTSVASLRNNRGEPA